MRNFIRRHKILAALCCVILGSEVWSLSAAFRGEVAARYDVAGGRYEELGYGLPVPWRREYVRLLREHYGIRFRTVALCIVSEDLIAYANSYNTVSSAAANRKFGHDVFKECLEEAESKWKAERTTTHPMPVRLPSSVPNRLRTASDVDAW